MCYIYQISSGPHDSSLPRKPNSSLEMEAHTLSWVKIVQSPHSPRHRSRPPHPGAPEVHVNPAQWASEGCQLSKRVHKVTHSSPFLPGGAQKASSPGRPHWSDGPLGSSGTSITFPALGVSVCGVRCSTGWVLTGNPGNPGGPLSPGNPCRPCHHTQRVKVATRYIQGFVCLLHFHVVQLVQEILLVQWVPIQQRVTA